MAKEGRDEKGRYIKGHGPINKDVARDYQLRAAEARKDNRIVADALRRALLGKDPDTDDPMIVSIVNGVTSRARKAGTFGDLRVAADILGELEQKVTENITMEMKFKFGDE